MDVGEGLEIHLAGDDLDEELPRTQDIVNERMSPKEKSAFRSIMASPADKNQREGKRAKFKTSAQSPIARDTARNSKVNSSLQFQTGSKNGPMSIDTGDGRLP